MAQKHLDRNNRFELKPGSGEQHPGGPGPITLRPMTHKDIPLGMRLKSAAGWNQLKADWEMLLKAGCEGSFVAMYDGIDVGTVTTLSYQRRFSWIGMVLVDPAFRRRGVGTTLLDAAIAAAKSVGPVRLDATPEGKKLYDTLGFKEEYRLVRMQRSAAPLAQEPNDRCHNVTGKTLLTIVRFDAPIFGADREIVLSALLCNAPQYAFCAMSEEQVIGYCMGRSGSNFEHIGPIVAQDAEIAQLLVLTALSNCAYHDVIVDALVNQKDWLTFLRYLGFAEQRPFIRMCLGDLRHAGQPDQQFAIAGPELG